MKKIIKYLPDIIILIGAWILSYNIFRPTAGPYGFSLNNYAGYKSFGILLIIIGLCMMFRRYIENRKK